MKVAVHTIVLNEEAHLQRWAQSAQEYGQADPTSMCDYRGDVLLLVNVADV